MKPNSIRGHILQSTIDFGDNRFDKCEKFADRLVLVRYMAFEREVWRVDLQHETRLHDSFVFYPKRFAERLQIVAQRIVMFGVRASTSLKSRHSASIAAGSL